MQPLSAHKVASKPPQRDWTLLYVLDGDNDLREAATLDLVELDQEGASPEIAVAAQLYRGELKWNLRNLPKKLSGLVKPAVPSAVQSDWRGVKVYEVRSGEETSTREARPWERTSPSDPQALRDFVAWGMRTYPAKNYAVILSGHGSQEGILSDSSGRQMSMADAATALKSGAREAGEEIDLLVLDSCSTASERTAEAFKGSADYLIASPNRIKGGGWSESKTLAFLKSDSKATPEALARSFLDPRHENITEARLYDLNEST